MIESFHSFIRLILKEIRRQCKPIAESGLNRYYCSATEGEYDGFYNYRPTNPQS